MQDSVPGLDPLPVTVSAECSEDSGEILGEGSVFRSVASQVPLDPWLGNLTTFYAERAAADGWHNIVVVGIDDPSVDEPTFRALEATRTVDGIPMRLILWAGSGSRDRVHFSFTIEAEVENGTFCEPSR